MREPQLFTDMGLGAFDIIELSLLGAIGLRVYEPVPYTLLSLILSVVLITIGLYASALTAEYLDKWSRSRGVPDGE